MRSKTRSTVNGTPGFTLAEILVTLAIFSLIVVVLSGGVRSGAAVWSRVEQTMSNADQVALSGQILGGMFDRSYSISSVPHFSEVAPEESSDTGFSFIHYAPAWPDVAEFVLIELKVEDLDGTKHLNLSRHRMVFEQGKSGGHVSTKTSALLSGASDIGFSYMHRDRATGAIKWKPEWTETDFLPRRVRLSLAFDKESVTFDFELKNAMAPGCLVGGSWLGCEVRK